MNPSENPAEKKPQIIVDEDWKEAVQRERAAENVADRPDEKGESDSAAPAMDYSQLPPADFSILVSMFSTQALVAMGMIPEPGQSEPRVQIALARHFIDLLGVLEEKTKGNLTENESSSLISNLHYLRMAFLEISGKK